MSKLQVQHKKVAVIFLQLTMFCCIVKKDYTISEEIFVFGYLKIDKGELLVKEYNAYKAVYCGLCKEIGKSYSFIARMLLSYDCTFYAIILMSLERSCNGFSEGRCTCNPLKKCTFSGCKSNAYKKAAALTVISAYYKLVDDIADGSLLKSLLCRIIKPFFSRHRKKAVKKYGFCYIDDIVSEMMQLQLEDEHNADSTIDTAAHPTANMLGLILKYEARSENEKLVLYELGYHLGRWIYLIDAADDIKRDMKSKNYNPFIKSGNINADFINSVLSQSLARAYNALALTEIVDFKGIVKNLLLKGLPVEQNRIIKKINEENDYE